MGVGWSLRPPTRSLARSSKTIMAHQTSRKRSSEVRSQRPRRAAGREKRDSCFYCSFFVARRPPPRCDEAERPQGSKREKRKNRRPIIQKSDTPLDNLGELRHSRLNIQCEHVSLRRRVPISKFGFLNSFSRPSPFNCVRSSEDRWSRVFHGALPEE